MLRIIREHLQYVAIHWDSTAEYRSLQDRDRFIEDLLFVQRRLDDCVDSGPERFLDCELPVPALFPFVGDGEV